MREELRQARLLPHSLGVDYQDGQVAGELGERLAAEAAGPGRRRRVGDHGHGPGLAQPGRRGGLDGVALGADRQRRNAVLDVGRGVDRAVLHEHGGTDGEMTVGRIGMGAGGRGRGDERFPVHEMKSSTRTRMQDRPVIRDGFATLPLTAG